MYRFKSVLLAGVTSAFLFAGAAASHSAEKVVTSIKPVHSLAAALMDGVDQPALIVDGAGSPHNWSLKPSQAALLQDAELIFWIGHELETFLDRPLDALAGKAKVVSLIETDGLVKLKFREGGDFEGHGHDEGEGEHHDEHGHDEHGHDDHDGHEEARHEEEDGHDDHAHEKHEEHHEEGHQEASHDEGHEGHDHAGEFDAHIWLDPVNAKVIVAAMAVALSEHDAANAAQYQKNAADLTKRLDDLIHEMEELLHPVHEARFVVFHDAYQYFEKRFGLKAAGSLTINPDVAPGAGRVREIGHKVKELGAKCIFAEPQFEPRLVKVIAEESGAKTGVLDPLGSGLKDGSDLYFDLIRGMAKSFRQCLS